MITHFRRLIIIFLLSFTCFSHGCSAELKPEQKKLVADLRDDLARTNEEVVSAEKDDALYSGGLVKGLIALRLEILKTNAALIEQRIHMIESGVRPNIVLSMTKPDPEKAATLAKEIEVQKSKVAEARREADRYAGGLVQALSESVVATSRSTLAMLEQQYFLAKYGMVLPTPQGDQVGQAMTAASRIPEKKPAAAVANQEPKDCMKIETFDSSVLSTNDVFTELAWKVDVANSCSEARNVRVRFAIYDKDDFELDSDEQDVYVPPNGIGKARGKMLVSPPEKARRMAKQGASISAR